MIGFLIGCVVGGTIGVVAMCCCVAAKEADKGLDCTDSDE